MIFHITVLKSARNTERVHGLMETDIKKIIALRVISGSRQNRWCWNTVSNWGIPKSFKEMELLGWGLEGKEEFAMRERKKVHFKVEEFLCPKTWNWSSSGLLRNSTQAGGAGSCRELGSNGWRGSRATQGAWFPASPGLFLSLCGMELDFGTGGCLKNIWLIKNLRATWWID